MNYIVETVNSENLNGIINLPASMRNMKVEVTVRHASGENRLAAADNSAYGYFRAYADPAKIAGEKGAWERAVLEKYATR
jgi:hypothetical protein